MTPTVSTKLDRRTLTTHTETAFSSRGAPGVTKKSRHFGPSFAKTASETKKNDQRSKDDP